MSPAAHLATQTARITHIVARRTAALKVMRAAAHEGSYVSWNPAVAAATAKSWIRSCGLSGDRFAPVLVREFVTQYRGRGVTAEVF